MTKFWKITLFSILSAMAVAAIVLCIVFYAKDHSITSKSQKETNFGFYGITYDHSDDFDFDFNSPINAMIGDIIDVRPNCMFGYYSFSFDDEEMFLATQTTGIYRANKCGSGKMYVHYDGKIVLSATVNVQTQIATSDEYVIVNNAEKEIAIEKAEVPLDFYITNSAGDNISIDSLVVSCKGGAEILNSFGSRILSAPSGGILCFDQEEMNIHLEFRITYACERA